jgi:hypothetical protein
MRVRLLLLFLLLIRGHPLAADEKPAPAATSDRMDQLIRQLGSSSFDEREAAAKQLIDCGEPALEKLQAAARNPDVEIRRRIKACINFIENALPSLPAGVAVIRLPSRASSLD